MQPTSATLVALIIVNHRIEGPPAPCLTSGPNGGFGVRRLWHVLLAFWLSINLVYQMKTRPVRAFSCSSGGQAIKRYDVCSFLIRLPYLVNCYTGLASQIIHELI
jgi:hypothetical protein